MATKKFNQFLKFLMKNKDLIDVLEEIIERDYLRKFKDTMTVEVKDVDIKHMIHLTDGKKSHHYTESVDSDELENIFHCFRQHLVSDSEEEECE